VLTALPNGGADVSAGSHVGLYDALKPSILRKAKVFQRYFIVSSVPNTLPFMQPFTINMNRIDVARRVAICFENLIPSQLPIITAIKKRSFQC
jgi:hypothetical protein